MLLCVGSILAAVSIIVTPVTLLIVAGIYVVYWARRGTVTELSVIWGVTGAIVLTLVVALFAAPWWPSERLNIANSSPITAYVLSETPQGWTILVAKPRRIEYIAPSEIIGRTLCEPSGSILSAIFGAPTPALYGKTSNYPKCP